MVGFAPAAAQGPAPDAEAPAGMAPPAPEQAPQPDERNAPAQPQFDEASMRQRMQQYDQFFDHGLRILYHPKFLPRASQILAASDASRAIATLGSMVATRLYVAASEQGVDPDPAAFVHAGGALVAEIADLARTLGHEVTGEDVQDAFILGSDQTREVLLDKGLITEDLLDTAARAAAQQMTAEQFLEAKSLAEEARARTARAVNGRGAGARPPRRERRERPAPGRPVGFPAERGEQ